METIRIEIVNKKVKKLLKELEDFNLITIQKEKLTSFQSTLNKLRNRKKSPSLKVITKEVESVRTKRYAKSTS